MLFRSVDGDGNQRREVAGGEETIRRPEEAKQDTHAGERFRRNFENLTRVYIYPGPVGVTEWNNSVAPRCRIASGYCNSV